MKKKIKLIIIQRICPHYRVPIFKEIAQRMDTILYYGKGSRTGANQNTKCIDGLPSKKLFTLSSQISTQRQEIYFCLFPFLIFHLFRDRPHVILTEGATNFINNIFVILYSSMTQTPVVWWDAGRNMNQKPSLHRRLVEPILIRLIKTSTACLGYGQNARDYFQSIGVIKDKIFIAQNTIDIESINQDLKMIKNDEIIKMKESLGLHGKRVILCVGALEKRKKLENLIEAYQKIKLKQSDVALLIIGDGQQKACLEKKVYEFKLEDVYFPGRITEGLGIYFLMSDLFVLPGWSTLAINQAMAYGLPVVTVPFGGPEHENVQEGTTGYIIKEDSITDLTEAMLKILKNDDLQRQMSQKAKELINSSVNLHNMVDNIESAVEEACH